ncbi:MAG: hypothetical protein ABI178_16165, partial [Rhodanobacter sp.]
RRPAGERPENALNHETGKQADDPDETGGNMSMRQFFPWVVMAASCCACNAYAATTRTINFSKEGIQPTAAQNLAIRRAAAADIKEFDSPEKDSWHVVSVDLNDDGHSDLLIQYTDRGLCGALGCGGAIVMATATGFVTHATSLPNFVYLMNVLGTKHHGTHDLRFDDAKYIVKWDGKEYR